MKNWRFSTNILLYFDSKTVKDAAIVTLEDE